MKKDFFPLIAMLLGIGIIFFGIFDSGGTIMMFISISSLLIVLVGSLCALAIVYPLKDLKKIPKLFLILTSDQKYDLVEMVNQFEQLSMQAKREGILSLENKLPDIEDEFVVNGLQLVIDGSEAEEIRRALNTELDALEGRHEHLQGVLAKWGSLAPGFGMLGTVIGLIVMLGDLGAGDPESLGAGMATALITTFYGSFFQNLIFDPVTENLRQKTAKEIMFKGIILEGVVMIQSGVNPRVVKDTLATYLSPEEKLNFNVETEKEYV
ncbi:MAG TPA: motility protein A [Firmicutes bacterium]|nr:motility protein A [Bacillota bacterium]